MPVESQAGLKAEVTYGLDVTVNRFFEFNKCNIEEERKRIEAVGLRASQRVQRSDRFVAYMAGAKGSVEFNPLSKGLGIWLGLCLGTVTTAGPTDSSYTHTATVASLTDDMFTFQKNDYDVSSANQAQTCKGGKVTAWEFSCAADGLLDAMIEMDFQDVTRGTALASASYPSGTVELFSFVGGGVTYQGASLPVKDWKIHVDNGLDTGRYKIKSSALKQIPVESKMREITWEATIDWDGLTQYNRFASTAGTGVGGTMVATFTAPTLLGTATYPSLTITIPYARLDKMPLEVDANGLLQSKISGRGLYDGTNSPVTVAYVSGDTTP